MKFMKKSLAVFLAMIMALSVFSVSVFADESEDTASGQAINFVGITVELPEDGIYPSNYHVLDSEAYEVADFTWSDAETDEVIFSSLAESLIETKPFVDGKVYTLTVTLYATSGYLFDMEDLVVSINGYAAEIEEVNLLGKRLVATCDFECKAEIIDDDNGATGITFDQVLDLLKTVLLTFVRLLGSLIGIK